MTIVTDIHNTRVGLFGFQFVIRNLKFAILNLSHD